MCLPRNSAPFLPSSRQRLRLALTSRIPTVIWVGRRSAMGTGWTTGSRTVVVMSGSSIWMPSCSWSRQAREGDDMQCGYPCAVARRPDPGRLASRRSDPAANRPSSLDPAVVPCHMQPTMDQTIRALEPDTVRSPLAAEVERRRTFAIISHPDAGKTTLTEKLLLFGGSIELAGQVKAKGERRHARSDWMAIERARGISVVTSVMTFEHAGRVFNLLDTPGHADFSEDTYRTLTAVDSAVMVIDAAKGIEARTRKLFEVCRLRDIPIITFINKMDRESRDTFELLDEIEKTLALDTTPMTWPVGRGRDFLGTYDLATGGVRLLEGGGAKTGAAQQIDIADLAGRNANLDVGAIKEELALVSEACKPFELEAFREGHLTPVYFGSALRNFGVGDLLEGLGRFAPPPRAQDSNLRKVEAAEPRMSAFVFKIQANMDPNHRDRIAFARLCSGKLTRGMKAKLVRTGKNMSLSSPQFFFAQDRALADEAYAGDVVGIPNHGTLRIGDTLTEGEDLTFVGVPSFAPEIVRRVRLTDAMKAKKLKEALQP